MRHMSRKPKAENREPRTEKRKATEPGLLIRVCKSKEWVAMEEVEGVGRCC